VLLAEVDYPFLNILWSMLIFFCFVIWIWTVFGCLADVFRRHDISGWGKAGWLVFMIVLPFLGVLAYIVTQGKGMADRSAEQIKAQQAQFDDHVREVAGSSAAEISQAKELLDKGAINQDEFEQLKSKALAS
jgi:Short C-terminal domain/Phospholipase_D-nuclease N-terminal